MSEREPMPAILDHREGPVPGPGLYRMPAALYHADPCPDPSLSSSFGKLIVGRSPKHARAAHPRLGAPPDEGDSTRPKEIGTAAHMLMLGRGAKVCPIEATDYKAGAARSERMRALAAGECPILAPDLALAEAAVAEGRRELATFLPEHPELPELADFLASEGDAETVLVWRDVGGVWCRAMVDWLSPSRRLRIDLTTTSASANPADVAARLFNTGTEFSDRFYARGMRALGLPAARSLYVMIETEPPHGAAIVELDQEAEDIGETDVPRAIETWGRCLASGHWPGYPPRIATAETPRWHVRAWEGRGLAASTFAERSPGKPGVPSPMLPEIVP